MFDRLTASMTAVRTLARRAIHTPRTAWLIALVFVLLGAMASLKTPLYQGSDEGWHYAYVEHYALGRPLVNLNKHFLSGDPAAPYWQTHEAAQPPLYYVLMGRIVALIPRGDLIQEQLLEGSVPNGMYGNLLPTDTGALGRGHALAGHLVRLLTVLMGAVVVLCAYGITHLITARPDIALLVAAITAFNPRNIVLSAAISNDMAVACAASLTLLLATYAIVENPSKPSRSQRSTRFIPLLLGVGSGVSLLMKYSGGAIAIAAAIALLCQAIRFQLSWRWLLRQWVLFGVGALLVTGWFFWHNWQLYGDILAWNKVQTIMPMRSELRSLSETLSWVPFILQTNFQHPVYTMALASDYTRFMYYALLLSMPGVLWLAWRRRAKWRQDLLLMSPVLATLAINFITFVPWLRTHADTENMRFFSPSYVPIGLLFSLGLLTFVPRRWWARFAAAVTLGYGLFTGATLWQGYNLIYPFPNYVTGIERDTLIQRNYPGRVMFENGIELLDAQIKDHRLELGQLIELTLVWRSTQPMTQSAHLTLDVHDERDRSIAALNTGNFVRYSYVTRAWQIGEPVRETYWLSAPVTHSQVVNVLAGWVTHSAPPRLIRPVNNPAISIEVARVKVRVKTPAVAEATPAIAHIVGLADLLSAEINQDEVVLRWRATAQPDQNYTIFVHGLDVQGQIVAQNDMAFAYSAAYWHTGEVFEQRMPFKGRNKTATVKIGVYDPATLQRLPAQSAAGVALAEDSVVIVGQ